MVGLGLKTMYYWNQNGYKTSLIKAFKKVKKAYRKQDIAAYCFAIRKPLDVSSSLKAYEENDGLYEATEGCSAIRRCLSDDGWVLRECRELLFFFWAFSVFGLLGQ